MASEFGGDSGHTTCCRLVIPILCCCMHPWCTLKAIVQSCDGSWRLTLPSTQGRAAPRRSGKSSRSGRSNWECWLQKNPDRRSSGSPGYVPGASGVARKAKAKVKGKARAMR